MRTFDVLVNRDTGVPFTLIDAVGNLVTGQAGAVVAALRDEDGAAAEAVVVSEQGASGFYEAHFTPTRSKDVGHVYFLRLKAPDATTDGAILEYTVRSFPSIGVSSVVGDFLTTLANVKEIGGLTGTGDDAALTSLIARLSALIEHRLRFKFRSASYDEVQDGPGRPAIVLRHRPVTAVASVHVSHDQVWDASTLVASSAYVVDAEAGIVRGKGYWFPPGPQNTRVSYTAGYGAVPLEVEHYAIQKVLEFFGARRHMGVTSIALKDGSLTRASIGPTLLKDIGEALPGYLSRAW